MKRFPQKLLGLTLVAGLIGFTAFAQNETPKSDKTEKSDVTEKKAPEKKAATVKAERGPLKTETSFKGVFESMDMVEVSVKPEAWGTLTVVKAVEPGTKVKAGDVLVDFDPEKIDKAIRDAAVDQELGSLALKLAELDLPLAEKMAPLELAAAERAYNHSREDYQKYQQIDRPLQIESVEFSVKSSKSALENQKEELKQLEKMYRSKDLTEETEEIILKRTRFQVEQAEFFMKNSLLRRDRVLNIDMPRRDKDLEDGQVRAQVAWDKARETLPMSLQQKKLALEKARQERTRSKEKYDNLKKDRDLFTVKAAADGIVYYGKSSQGNWTGSLAKMQKGGTVSSEEVFMTIVKPGNLFVRGSVDEKDCRALAAGQPAKITTPAYPDAKLSGTIERVASVPVGGSYEVRTKLKPTDVGVIPGMSAQVKVVTYEKKDALTVPSSAVFSEDSDDDAYYVYRPAVNGGKPTKVTVKIGKRTGGKTEILEGLSEGDEILKEKP